MGSNALSKISYGLYILTAKDGDKNNGCVINTVLQTTSSPTPTGVISVSKKNYTNDIITKTKKFNISVLTTQTPFDLIKHFGFKSGRDVNKFSEDLENLLCNFEESKSSNGIFYIPRYTNSYLSFDVTDMFDFGTHTMFKGDIVDNKVISDEESLTYSYYHANIKPKAEKSTGKKGHRCIICGYIYDGDPLPEDYICPICKHPASDFEKL